MSFGDLRKKYLKIWGVRLNSHCSILFEIECACKHKSYILGCAFIENLFGKPLTREHTHQSMELKYIIENTIPCISMRRRRGRGKGREGGEEDKYEYKSANQ